MEYLTQLIDAVRADPRLGAGIAVGVVAILLFLNRKPRIQRDADDRLSVIRREKSEQYNKLRPPH